MLSSGVFGSGSGRCGAPASGPLLVCAGEMACYHPVPAYQGVPGEQVRLNPPLGTANLSVPCGGCLGCKSDRALQWAHRCMHEARCWPANAFLTLTYSDDALPDPPHLVPRDLTLFFKRLRKYANRPGGLLDCSRRGPLRYFACGEYGDRTQRPHYHALVFNLLCRDLEPVGTGLWSSSALTACWGLGHVAIGEVTPASANYVAQYSLKKLGGSVDCDPDGVVRLPPFLRMSRRPGIGDSWLRSFREDLRGGYMVIDGTQHRVPRAYLRRLRSPSFAAALGDDLSASQLADTIVARAVSNRLSVPSDRACVDRLAAAEVIHSQRVARRVNSNL